MTGSDSLSESLPVEDLSDLLSSSNQLRRKIFPQRSRKLCRCTAHCCVPSGVSTLAAVINLCASTALNIYELCIFTTEFRISSFL